MAGRFPGMAMKRSGVPPSQKVADRLRRILAYHELSGSDLASAVGVTPAAVSQWLSATTAVSPASALRISEALGEDFEFVMGRADKGTQGLGAAMAALESIFGGELAKRIEILDHASAADLRALVTDFLENRAPQRGEKTDDSNKI